MSDDSQSVESTNGRDAVDEVLYKARIIALERGYIRKTSQDDLSSRAHCAGGGCDD